LRTSNDKENFMRKPTFCLVLFVTLPFFGSIFSLAQDSRVDGRITPMAASAPTDVPALIPYSGIVLGSDGGTLFGEVGVTFLIFTSEQGGEPLFSETQAVVADSAGRFTAQLGASLANGLPSSLFATGEARWLEVQVAGQGPQPRVLLASVPYAMKASDAATLGGLPASAFVLAGTKAAAIAGSPDAAPPATNVTTTGGVIGYIPEFSGASTVVDSPLFVSGTDVGIGTSTPAATLDVNGAALISGLLTANDGETVGGTLEMAPTDTATASTPYNSQVLKLYSSAYNSASKSVVNPRFGWQARATDNDTTAPSGTLNLLSSATGAAPAPTGFSFNLNGTINFAPGQTFPAATFTGAITDSAAVAGGNAISGTNTAVLGTGVSGTGAGPGGYGVTGVANGDGNTGFTPVGVLGYSIPGYGVSAITSSGTALYGEAKTTGQAGYFTSAFSGPMNGEVTTPFDSASVAIYNTNSAANANGNYNDTNPQGLYVEADGLNATGILGTVPSGYGIGVWGTAGAGSNTAANLRYGIFNAGVWGDTVEGYDGSPQYYGVIGTTDDNTAGYFINNGPDYPTIGVANYDAGGPTGLFKTIQASTPDGTCGFGGKGNLTCTGQVKTLATTSKSRMVETYAMQSPENWIEDFGSASLANGIATVAIDPAFAETVSASADYHVFLTPNGDSKGLYVTAKSATSFEVRESGGGTSTLAFDYRIVAKRLGHESERLVDVTDRFHAETAETTKRMQEAANAHGAVRKTRPASRVLPAPQIPQVPGQMQPTALVPQTKVVELR
jgi:hypothetical protein